MATSTVEGFLTREEEIAVVGAIRTAERNTSGEIRVHLEAHSGTDAFARATEVFGLLHMNNTKQSNGVLIYIAVKDKALVILGDSGINRAVPPDFWEGTKNLIVAAFKSGTIKQGLVNGILQAGQQLKEHFPHRAGDVNELPDGISVG